MSNKIIRYCLCLAVPLGSVFIICFLAEFFVYITGGSGNKEGALILSVLVFGISLIIYLNNGLEEVTQGVKDLFGRLS